MNCEKALGLIKDYVMGELDSQTSFMLEKHFQGCSSCNTHYMQTKESILNNPKNSTTSSPSASETASKHSWGIVLTSVAAAVFLMMFILTSSVIAFPAFASKVVPGVPLVKQLLEAKNNYNTALQENQEIKKLNEKIKQENEQIKEENEKLKMAFKAVSEEYILQVETNKGISEDENNKVKSLAMDFIKAQYKGDLEKLKAMCTDEFKIQIDEKKDVFLKNNKAEFAFNQITNVAKDGDLYLIFVRLSDSHDFSEYQINFEFVKKNEEFYVSNVDFDI